MSHLSATRLTFSPKWDTMDDDERTAEQVAADDIVSKCGGEIKAQYVLWSDNCLLSIVDYPDEISAVKSELAIARRGASGPTGNEPYRSRTSSRGRTRSRSSRGANSQVPFRQVLNRPKAPARFGWGPSSFYVRPVPPIPDVWDRPHRRTPAGSRGFASVALFRHWCLRSARRVTTAEETRAPWSPPTAHQLARRLTLVTPAARRASCELLRRPAATGASPTRALPKSGERA